MDDSFSSLSIFFAAHGDRSLSSSTAGRSLALTDRGTSERPRVMRVSQRVEEEGLGKPSWDNPERAVALPDITSNGKGKSNVQGDSGSKNGRGAEAETIGGNGVPTARTRRDSRQVQSAVDRSSGGRTGGGSQRNEGDMANGASTTSTNLEGTSNSTVASRERNGGSQERERKRKPEGEPEDTAGMPDDVDGKSKTGSVVKPGPSKARGKVPRGRNINVPERASSSVAPSSQALALEGSPSGRKTRSGPLT